MRRVYQFHLQPPTDGAQLVRAQLRAAHEYRNDLVAIERGRRAALRAVDDTEEVREAIATVKASTKKDRQKAIGVLRAARKSARADAADELARIQALDAQIRRDARALTRCFWGSYLTIEAAAMQARSAPLYQDDAITPSDPRFVAWRGQVTRAMPGGEDVFPGQLGIQLQGGLATRDALAGTDTRVRLVMRDGPYGTLWLRVGSDGRDPVWAQWPAKVHRRIPDAALWKWVRVSLRREGLRYYWSAEVTVDDPSPPARTLDRSLDGAIFVEWEWTSLDDGCVRVATWNDHRGTRGEVSLPAGIVTGIRKSEGIRAVRDLILNDEKLVLARMIRESKEKLPVWLREAGNTMHLWQAADRFRRLRQRWQAERFDGARDTFERLDTWEARDRHLLDYEANGRGEALRERRDVYRFLAARWSRMYRTAVLSDQDLSREARFGDEASVRQLAAVYELRTAIRNAFGVDAIDGRWRDKPDTEDERSWCERARDAWMAGGARAEAMFAKRKEQTGNAWAARKARAAEKRVATEAARDANGKCAE